MESGRFLPAAQMQPMPVMATGARLTRFSVALRCRRQGHGPTGKRLSPVHVLDLDAEMFLHDDDEFHRVQRIEAQAFPEQECVFIDVPGGQPLQVQILHEDLLDLLNHGHRIGSRFRISKVRIYGGR